MADVDDALQRLHAQLVRLDVPIVHYLRPGTPRDEATARVRQATGLPLPDEAAAWFAWQGGVAQRDPRLAPYPLWVWALFGVEQAIDQYRRWMRTAGKIETAAPSAEVVDWDTRWFPLAQDLGGTPLMVVCGGDRDGQVDTIHYDDPNLIGYTYPSVGWVVDAWTRLIDERIWDYDHTANRWARHAERLRGDPGFGLG